VGRPSDDADRGRRQGRRRKGEALENPEDLLFGGPGAEDGHAAGDDLSLRPQGAEGGGGYVPFFVTERKRSEMALATLVQESFINGVSTRRIERLAQALGIENICASQVSEINKGLGDRIITLALMIAPGVNGNGSREILAIEPMFDESEDPWREFFHKLKKRGVRRISLCVSDAHAGIQAAVKKELLGGFLTTLRGPFYAEHPG
jgi:hypothetical protein